MGLTVVVNNLMLQKSQENLEYCSSRFKKADKTYDEIRHRIEAATDIDVIDFMTHELLQAEIELNEANNALQDARLDYLLSGNDAKKRAEVLSEWKLSRTMN